MYFSDGIHLDGNKGLLNTQMNISYGFGVNPLFLKSCGRCVFSLPLKFILFQRSVVCWVFRPKRIWRVFFSRE